MFDVDSPKPIRVYSTSVPILGLCFLEDSLVYLNTDGEFVDLGDGTEPPALCQDSSAAIDSTDAAPSSLSDLFGLAPIREQRPSDDDAELQGLFEYAPQQQQQSTVFDAPSHILPSLATLYASFMDTVLLKPTAVDQEQLSDDANAAQEDAQEDAAPAARNGELSGLLPELALPQFDIHELTTALTETHLSPHYVPFANFFRSQFGANPGTNNTSTKNNTTSKGSSSAAQDASAKSASTAKNITSKKSAPTEAASAPAKRTPGKSSKERSRSKEDRRALEDNSEGAPVAPFKPVHADTPHPKACKAPSRYSQKAHPAPAAPAAPAASPAPRARPSRK